MSRKPSCWVFIDCRLESCIQICRCVAGPRTVIHPKARIIADAGPIIIGEGNLIEEQALIINRYSFYLLSVCLYLKIICVFGLCRKTNSSVTDNRLDHTYFVCVCLFVFINHLICDLLLFLNRFYSLHVALQFSWQFTVGLKYCDRNKLVKMPSDDIFNKYLQIYLL